MTQHSSCYGSVCSSPCGLSVLCSGLPQGLCRFSARCLEPLGSPLCPVGRVRPADRGLPLHPRCSPLLLLLSSLQRVSTLEVNVLTSTWLPRLEGELSSVGAGPYLQCL